MRTLAQALATYRDAHRLSLLIAAAVLLSKATDLYARAYALHVAGVASGDDVENARMLRDNAAREYRACRISN